jgi:hypothetical protein
MVNPTISIEFNSDSVPPHLASRLETLGLKSTDDLLAFLSIHFDTYVNTPTDEILQLFENKVSMKENSKIMLDGFDYSDLKAIIDRHKSKICEFTFESFHKTVIYTESDEDGSSVDIDDIIEPADSLDLDQLIPTETLFLRCITTSSTVKVISIEDVLRDIEDEICDNLDEEDAEEGLRLHYEDMLTNYMSDSDWPCGYPIYISTEFAIQYPRIVNLLVSKALIVIKGI